MATIVTRSGKGSPLTHAEVDSNFTNLNTDKLELSGGTMTGNLSFGDNDKAIFGAGSDLQIYHSGTHSDIDEVGTGNLRIGAENFVVQNADHTENMISAAPNGQVVLYYDNSIKFNTSSTGVNITGTLTSDGLTVESSSEIVATIRSTDPTVGFDLADSVGFTRFTNTNGSLRIDANDNGSGSEGEIRLASSGSNKALFSSNGDISFYEDTGTTPKFFWDASAERLGIGTSSPSDKLHVEGDIRVNNAIESAGNLNLEAENGSMRFQTGTGSPSERMRIDSSGNVGIGTSSPTSNLHVKTSSFGDVYQIKLEDGGGTAGLELGQYGSFGQVNGLSGLDFEIGKSLAMRIDSSGNLLVGTTSVGSSLDGVAVAGANQAVSSRGNIYVYTTDSQAADKGGQITFGGSYTGTTETIWAAVAGRKENGTDTNTSGYLQFSTRASGGIEEAMRIDSSGNVGIGTSSPTRQLDVEDTSANAYVQVTTSAARTAGLLLGDTSDRLKGRVAYLNDVDALQLYSNGTERMRIDSSGNLLVGKTSADFGSGRGVELRPTGNSYFTNADGNALRLNRLNSDGEILTFRKDGTTVGSIGSVGGVDLNIGTDTTGLRFYDGSNADGGTGIIVPWNVTANSARDAQMNLGSSTERFRNLYLSGGVYLGGTGSANKLDDYEAGTFTPVVAGSTVSGTGTYSVQTGRYVKTGNSVTIEIVIALDSHTGTGNLTVTGLPFISEYICHFTTVSYGLNYTGDYLSAGTNTNAVLSLFGINANSGFSNVGMDGNFGLRIYGTYIDTGFA